MLDAFLSWFSRRNDKSFHAGVNEGLKLAIERIRYFEVGEFNKAYRERLIAVLAKELK